MDEYGYVCFYKDKRVEVVAGSSYAAVLKVAAQLKVPVKKQYMISAHLAEKNGVAVVHVADF